MTGPEHYKEAERLIKDGRVLDGKGADMTAVFTLAQVHATLALAAATAMGLADLPAADWDQWRDAASAYVRPQPQPAESEGSPA